VGPGLTLSPRLLLTGAEPVACPHCAATSRPGERDTVAIALEQAIREFDRSAKAAGAAAAEQQRQDVVRQFPREDGQRWSLSAMRSV
jgi:hypothetical protein